MHRQKSGLDLQKNTIFDLVLTLFGLAQTRSLLVGGIPGLTPFEESPGGTSNDVPAFPIHKIAAVHRWIITSPVVIGRQSYIGIVVALYQSYLLFGYGHILIRLQQLRPVLQGDLLTGLIGSFVGFGGKDIHHRHWSIYGLA